MISHVREVPLRKQLRCTRRVLANEESVDEHFDVVEGAEHGRCEDRSETNAGEFVLPNGLFISLGYGSAHFANRHLSFAGLEGGACNHCVEIVRWVAVSAGHISGTANSETSGRGVHQHRYRAHAVRGPLQLPSRKDWKPSIRPYSHRAWFRGRVDARRACGRPSRVVFQRKDLIRMCTVIVSLCGTATKHCGSSSLKH